MNSKILIFCAIIALLYFLYYYQNRLNKKKRHDLKKKKNKKSLPYDLATNEYSNDQKKTVRIDEKVTEFQPESIDSELDYLSLSGMDEESQKYDSLSILDNISDDTNLSNLI